MGTNLGAQTILVVEDEFLIRMLLADSLRAVGYQILEACDGEEGTAVLASGQAVDLIITDVRMPGKVDGMALTRHAKKLDASRPVIVCSGHLPPDESHPADMFIPKPYSEATLIEVAERLIGIPCEQATRTRTA